MRTQARKLAAAGLTAAMTVTMLAACGTKATPENLLRDMSKRAEETESITANIMMELDVAASGESAADENNGKQHTDELFHSVSSVLSW